MFAKFKKNLCSRVTLKKSDSKVPEVELTEIGPHMNFVLRRTKLASDDLFKTACRKPLQLKVMQIIILYS